VKRLLLVLLLCLGLFAGATVSPPSTPVVGPDPATADWYQWSQSGCRADIEWMATSAGVWYWRYGWSETYGAKMVPWGHFETTYAGYGHECGFLGAPTTGKFCSGGQAFINFQGGQISRNYC
jgi:hypothetical protein